MGNETAKQKEFKNDSELKTYQQLLSMGFTQELSWKATTKYKGNLNKSINYSLKKNKNENKNAVTQEIVTEQNVSKNKQSLSVSNDNNNANDEKMLPQLRENQVDENVKHTEIGNYNDKDEAHQILFIYKKLLKQLQHEEEEAKFNLKNVYDEFNDIQTNLLKKQNHLKLYETRNHFMNCIENANCNPNKCKYIIHKYRDRSIVSSTLQYEQNENMKDFEYKLIKDLLSDVHCFIVHIYDLRLLTPNEMKHIDDKISLHNCNNDIDDIDRKQYMKSSKLIEKQSRYYKFEQYTSAFRNKYTNIKDNSVKNIKNPNNSLLSYYEEKALNGDIESIHKLMDISENEIDKFITIKECDHKKLLNVLNYYLNQKNDNESIKVFKQLIISYFNINSIDGPTISSMRSAQFANELKKYLKNKKLGDALSELHKAIINHDFSLQIPDIIDKDEETEEEEEYDQKDDEQKDDEQKDDDHVQFVYDFGIKLTYWNEDDACYVKCKYSTLKDEITNNNIFKLTIEQWDELVNNCDFLYNTDTLKNYLSKSNGNPGFDIKENTVMPLKHLQSVKLYTDYTELCTALCMTFRKKNKTETLTQVKKRNSEFGIWSKLLCECIQSFGKCMSDETESIQRVYRGINNDFIFNKFIARFNAPTSCSTDLCVAHKFAGNRGMILELSQKENSQCFYFECGPISAFPEAECIFFGGDSILQIVTIVKIENEQVTNYRYYLEAIHFLLTMVNGGDCDDIEISHKGKNELINIMEYKLNSKKDSIPKYIKQLIDHHTSITISTVNVNFRDLKEKHKFLKMFFLKNDIYIGMINIINICKCFLSIKCIQITLPPNYVFDNTFINSLFEDLKHLSSVNQRTLEIIFNFDGSTSYNQYVLNGHYNKFEKINWQITHHEQCTDFKWAQYIKPVILQSKKEIKNKKKQTKWGLDEIEINPTLFLLISYYIRISQVFIPHDIILYLYLYYGKYQNPTYTYHARIWICSWNMSGIKTNELFSAMNLKEIIVDKYDLYVFAVQEAIPTFISKLSDFFETVNCFKIAGGDLDDDIELGIYHKKSTKFTGMLFFLKKHLYPNYYVQSKTVHVESNEKDTRLAVCVGLQIYDQITLFISTNIDDCNYFNILISKCEKKLCDVYTSETLFAGYDHVICCGTLNSRIALTTNQVIKNISDGNSAKLWRHDNLRHVLKNSACRQFREPIPTTDFYPTYPKHKNRKNDYPYHQSYDTKYKFKYTKTTISFSDRCLYCSSPNTNGVLSVNLQPDSVKSVYKNGYHHNYGTIVNDLMNSTHSAIFCTFDLETNKKGKEKKKKTKNKKKSNLCLTEDNKDEEFKITMLGGGAVGKSTLVIRVVTGDYVDGYDPTIAAHYRKRVTIDGIPCLLEILDTQGIEQFRALRDGWIRESDAFLIVYSITDRRSFDEVELFREQIMKVKDDEDPVIVLVGTKCDLADQRQMWDQREVEANEGFNLANDWGKNTCFYEVSAKERINHQECFYDAARLLAHSRKK